MKRTIIKPIPKDLKGFDNDIRYDQISRHMRRKADALQANRWRKLNRELKQSPYIDNVLVNKGGLL